MSWVAERNQLHVTIGSSPQTIRSEAREQIDLNSDLSMVKAALLYGDKVTLCSPISAVLLGAIALTNPPDNERLYLFKKFAAWGLIGEEDQSKLEKILDHHDSAWRRRYSKKGQAELRKFKSILDEVWNSIVIPEVNRKMSEIGVDGISQALHSGLLEMHTFGTGVEELLSGDDYKDFAWEYVDAVAGSLADAKTYPLFDEDTANLIGAAIMAGKIPISSSGVSRSKEIRLAADLFNRLPLFPGATVKEVLDIRRELETALIRFRAAVIAFSEKIKNAAWDADFSMDAEQVFARDVAPEILNIEAAVKSNAFLSALTLQFSEKAVQLGGVVTGSVALSGLAVKMSNLPLLDVAALAVGPLLAAAGITHSAFRKWKSEIESTEQNNLFFYYRAGQLLEEGTYQYVSDKL